MKKNMPAKKGFSPFKESNSSNNKKNTGEFRPRRKPATDEAAPEKPERTEWKRPERPVREITDRKFGEKPQRKEGKYWDKTGEERKAFRETDRTEPRPRIAGKKNVKTANGRTPFKPRVQKDDSAFHGTSSSKGREERATPSGFNRKKFFDSANDRFADKQERKIEARKTRGTEERPKKEFKRAAPADRRKPSFDRNDSDRRKPSFERNDSDRRKPSPERKKLEFRKSNREDEIENINGEMPLNKYIAHCGLCSRRKAVDYVKEGKVTVNGTVVTEPAFKVTTKDQVTVNSKKLSIQKNLVYILLNKPKGYITTTEDPEGRKTVMELIEDAVTEDQRVYPVGRLDRNTSGLLLLTNDGELAQKLAHPKHNIRKIYHVGLDKPLTKADFDQIVNGVTLEDGVAVVDALGYVETNDRKEVGIEIHSGKNRIVRRIFEHLGYEVEKLDRVTYAGLTKKNVNRGKWRFLSEKEVILLKHFK
jgi:23S rRNA pseudouridine2605 synthase